MTPNPSFERTSNGMAPWPRSAVAHHALRGQGATPLLVRSTPTLGATSTTVSPSMALSIEMAHVALRSQPFSVLLGAELTSFDSECVELRIPITEHVKQQHGFVHGGVISYAADNALTFAGGAALGPAVVTSEFKINYLRPAKGEVLVARASVVHAGKSQAVCQCQVFAIAGGEEALCAVAQGTIAALVSQSDA
jgi:uncharacterized protein (TIGR00369 family)